MDGLDLQRAAEEKRLHVAAGADCTYCGGEVVEQTIDYDYPRQKNLMIVTNVPASVCRQYGEKYFKPHVLKRMDSVYHGIFERHEKPERMLTIPALSL